MRDDFDDDRSRRTNEKSTTEMKNTQTYDVRIHTPPAKDLGTFLLARDVHCGDGVQCANDWFIVSRVTTSYTLHRGKYVKDRSRLDVVRVERFIVNASLERLFLADDGEWKR